MTINKKGRKRLGIIRGISGIVLLSSFILVLGTAGASDLNRIALNRLIINYIVSMILMVVSGYIFNWADYFITTCKVRKGE